VTQRPRWFSLVLLALCGGLEAQAQDVTGTVRVSDGRAPLSGAIVILVAPSGTRVTAALTDEAGSYRLRAPSPGTFSLRVDVVGYRSTTTEPFSIPSGATVTRDIIFGMQRTQLPAVAVTATSTCDRISGDAGDAPRLWGEARKTLEAARLAIAEHRFNVALRRFERTIGLPDSVLRASRTWTQTGVTQNPFESLSPEALSRDGFSVQRDTGRYYYAPDANVLLSDAFVEGHCFGTIRGGQAGALGLTFRPQRTTARVDISGVLWLDSSTAELRSLEYRYVPSPGRQDVAGGLVAFGRYPSGVWGVQRWTIRLPVLQVNESRRRPDGALGRFVDTMVVAVHEVGGEVVAAGSSAASSPSTATRLRGMVFDSTQGAPLVGAVVTLEGLGRTTNTDSAGQFVFDSLSDEGDVRVRVWHPRLDSLGLPALAQTQRLRRRTESTAEVRTHGIAEVARQRCPSSARNTSRVITGVVRSAIDSTAPAQATEVVLLERRGMAAGGLDSLVTHGSITSDLGRYAFCAIVPGSQAWLVVREGQDWSDPRYVSDSAPPVAIVALRTPAKAGTATDSATSGAPLVVLGRTLAADRSSRVAGWVLLPENAPGAVQVHLDDVVRDTVNPDGSFAVDNVSAGARKLTFRSPAVAMRHVSVNVQSGQSQLLLVALKSAPLIVVQRSDAVGNSQLTEFRRRRSGGGGVFLDRAEIERRNPRTLTDLVRTIPGVRVVPRPTGFRYVSSHFRRVAGDIGTCDVMLYLDGQPFLMETGDADVRIRISEIIALEAYVTAGSVPRQFAGSDAACGVILIWR